MAMVLTMIFIAMAIPRSIKPALPMFEASPYLETTPNAITSAIMPMTNFIIKSMAPEADAKLIPESFFNAAAKIRTEAANATSDKD